ncbi:MAG: hypothetical protein [Circoviridae sp.]|nr:MAG: hypothetical protein [Circoviridae sp.]
MNAPPLTRCATYLPGRLPPSTSGPGLALAPGRPWPAGGAPGRPERISPCGAMNLGLNLGLGARAKNSLHVPSFYIFFTSGILLLINVR